jgi:hypothetical protein
LLPGKLRIDIEPAANGNGYVLVDGNVTILQGDKVVGTHPLVNMLLVLGFDVYTQDPGGHDQSGEGRRLRFVEASGR